MFRELSLLFTPSPMFFSYADLTCSGKRTCQIRVGELVYHSNPCPKELMSFFEASHQCLSGLSFLVYEPHCGKAGFKIFDMTLTLFALCNQGF